MTAGSSYRIELEAKWFDLTGRDQRALENTEKHAGCFAVHANLS